MTSRKQCLTTSRLDVKLKKVVVKKRNLRIRDQRRKEFQSMRILYIFNKLLYINFQPFFPRKEKNNQKRHKEASQIHWESYKNVNVISVISA